MRMRSLKEKMEVAVERDFPGRNKGMEAWKSMVNARNIKVKCLENLEH